MYYYEVGYGSYEDSERIMLTHETLFSEKEFRDLVSEVTMEVMKREIEKHNYVSCSEHRFDWLCDDTAKALCDSRGFSIPKPTAKFRPFGWESFINLDWTKDGDDVEEDLLSLNKAATKAGYTQEWLADIKAKQEKQEKEDG